MSVSASVGPRNPIMTHDRIADIPVLRDTGAGCLETDIEYRGDVSRRHQGTAGYVTRMSGGVGDRGREASSYPD